MATSTDPDSSADPGSPGDPAAPGRPRRSEALQPYDAYVSDVLAGCREPGVQQALRRALAKQVKEVPARTHAILLRNGWIPDDVRDRRPYYAVAALIAARPRAQRETGTEAAASSLALEEDGFAVGAGEPAENPQAATGDMQTDGFRPGGTNLGESIALAVVRRDDSIKEDGAESRLHLMVRQDIEGLHRMLPAVVRLVSGTGVRVDYACLLKDLRSWPRYRDEVATRWLESFYRTLRTERAKKGNGDRDSPA